MYARCSSARSTTPESTEPMRARTRSPGRAFPLEPRRKYSRRAARTTSDALRPDLRAVRSSAVASSAGRRTVSCDSIMHYIVVHLQCMRQRGAGGTNRGQDARKHYPMDPPDPIEPIKFRMEQQGLTRKDLERV